MCFSDSKLCWGFIKKKTKKVSFKSVWYLDEIDSMEIIKKDLFHDALRVKFKNGSSRVFRVVNGNKMPCLSPN